MWSGVSQVPARDFTPRPITLDGDGDQTRDFTYVHDAVAEAVAPATLGVPGRVYNIGGGARVSVNKVLEMTGARDDRSSVRPTTCGLVDPAQKDDMRHTRLARTDFGFVSAVNFEEGLTAECPWLTGILT